MTGAIGEYASAARPLDDLFAGSTAPVDSDVGEELTFSYEGRGRDIVGLTAINALLSIITLSFYRFWGRTNVRRHILARTLINGEPMEYTGTGWEMCKGFLIVMFGVMLPLAGLVIATQLFAPLLFPIVFLGVYFLFFFLVNFAVYAARRYRFSRATWRGIRFAMDGSAVSYAWASIGYGILSGITFGWYAPAAQLRLSRLLWEETLFGSTRIKIRLPEGGLAAPAYGPFALLWFGGLFVYLGMGVMVFLAAEYGYYDPYSPTDVMSLVVLYGITFGAILLIAVLSIPYQAALMRRTAEMVGIGGAHFRLDVRSPSLFWLYFSNGLILILTLGLGEPIVSARTFRYVFNRLASTGKVNINAIMQSKSRGPGTGEGLADAFDVGGF